MDTNSSLMYGGITGAVIVIMTSIYKIIQLICKNHIHSQCMTEIDNNNNNNISNDGQGNKNQCNTIRESSTRQESPIHEIQKDSPSDP